MEFELETYSVPESKCKPMRHIGAHSQTIPNEALTLTTLILIKDQAPGDWNIRRYSTVYRVAFTLRSWYRGVPLYTELASLE